MRSSFFQIPGRLVVKHVAALEGRARQHQHVDAVFRKGLGDVVYGVDVESLEAVASGLLRRKGLTLSAAESCTGGLIAKRITGLPGASAIFRGGVVSYTNAVKANADQGGQQGLGSLTGLRPGGGADHALVELGVGGQGGVGQALHG